MADDPRYTRRVVVRYSERQARALEKIARATGMGLSTYIRWRTVGALAQKDGKV